MPSPIGHALGGIAAGSVVLRSAGWRTAAALAFAGGAADLDFLLPIQHRGPSHGIGSALLAAGIALMYLGFARGTLPRVRLAVAIGLAYASHILLDWLGTDRSEPSGLMALWPFSTAYYASGLDVFPATNRRYWTPGFWSGNAMAVLRELLILAPLAALVWRWRFVKPHDR